MGTKFIAFVLIFALSLGLCVYSSVQLNAGAEGFGPGEGELLYGGRSEAEGLEIELRALLDSTGALGWRSVYDAGSGVFLRKNARGGVCPSARPGFRKLPARARLPARTPRRL